MGAESAPAQEFAQNAKGGQQNNSVAAYAILAYREPPQPKSVVSLWDCYFTLLAEPQ